jgi:hypothetical protein
MRKSSTRAWHGGGPHANFETLELNPTTQRMQVVANHHVFFN